MTKNIVLTGGASGIGLELLKLLLDEGHRVAVIVRTDDQISGLKNAFPSTKLGVFTADLSDQSAILQVAARIRESLGSVDVLFNNAGVMLGKIAHSKQGNEMHFEVNALAPYILTYSLHPALTQTPVPLVVNTATDGLDFARSINVSEIVNPKKNQSALSLYLNSKLAGLLLMNHLSSKLKFRVVHASPSGNKTKLSQGDGMPFWMKPFVFLLYKDPRFGANLLYQAAFQQQHLDKTQIYLQNNAERTVRCPISEEQIQELLGAIKVDLAN
ncbi:MAG: SDR family NAD(P)-dependent oxidoreductase [Anaerolineales bacterium]|nr:SDR family NAD(P)-dependent oxidoreductase [Anaerolineales bacterium]